MLLLGLQWGGITFPWSSSIIIGLLVGAGVTFLVFVPWQLRRGDKALIPPHLFTVNRNPVLICTAAFFVNGPFQTIIYWLPIWFQGVLRTSPTRSGINYFPTVVSDVLAAFIGSGLVAQIGWWNPFILFAEALVCVGGGLLSTLNPGIFTGYWIGYQIFGGVGYSLASNLVSRMCIWQRIPQLTCCPAVSPCNAVLSAAAPCSSGFVYAPYDNLYQLCHFRGHRSNCISRPASNQSSESHSARARESDYICRCDGLGLDCGRRSHFCSHK